MEDSGRTQRVTSFEQWRAHPGLWPSRTQELDKLAADDPNAWLDAILTLMPNHATVDWLEQENLTWLGAAVAAALRTAPDREAMEADLAKQARLNPTVASVTANALVPPRSNAILVEHGINVLGENCMFDAWSRAHWNSRDNKGNGDPQATQEVEVDAWPDDWMRLLTRDAPEAAWAIFLRYLQHESDAGLRAQAGIAWLETINFRFAAEFIERIEAEAKKNERLRAVLRRMYPPAAQPAIAERFMRAATQT